VNTSKRALADLTHGTSVAPPVPSLHASHVPGEGAGLTITSTWPRPTAPETILNHSTVLPVKVMRYNPPGMNICCSIVAKRTKFWLATPTGATLEEIVVAGLIVHEKSVLGSSLWPYSINHSSALILRRPTPSTLEMLCKIPTDGISSSELIWRRTTVECDLVSFETYKVNVYSFLDAERLLARTLIDAVRGNTKTFPEESSQQGLEKKTKDHE